jgi:hypothetical protein
MKIEPGNFCPLLQKDCIGLQCAWITQVRGTNPNTGEEVDEWKCAVQWLPILILENAQQQRMTNATVQCFRNEYAQTSQETDKKNKSLLDMIQNNIISASIQEVENSKNFLGEAEIIDEQ